MTVEKRHIDRDAERAHERARRQAEQSVMAIAENLAPGESLGAARRVGAWVLIPINGAGPHTPDADDLEVVRALCRSWLP